VRALGLAFAVLVLVPATQTGCYWKYRNVAGDPFPQWTPAQPIGGSAGLTVSPSSTEPKASSITKTAVVELLAERLVQEKLFETVIFPYSTLSQVKPSIFLDATVRIEEKHNWGENLTKAVFVGLSLFLLSPVLATHFGVVVDLDVHATSADGTHIGSYAYRSEYDFHYTTMTPRQDKLDEWLDKAKRHAVEEVLNQIERDREKFLPYAKTARLSWGRWF
jgi:hypothetical protein